MKRTTRRIGQHYPYHVVVRVGTDKLVTEMISEMYAYCRMLELPCRLQTGEAWTHMNWCFASPVHARTFQRQFGGELVTATEG